LRINDVDNNLLAFVAGDMPTHLKEGLAQALRTSIETSGNDLWKEMDSEQELKTFPTFHFSTYARNITKVS
jgi:hypothetical protein